MAAQASRRIEPNGGRRYGRNSSASIVPEPTRSVNTTATVSVRSFLRCARIPGACARAAMATAEPHAMSYYVGESDLLAAPDRARRCFTEASWRQLREIRTRRDPEGRFCHR